MIFNTGCSKKVFSNYFIAVLVSNCLEFQSQILITYAVILCARNSFVSVNTLLSVKYVSIAAKHALSDFSMLKNVKEIAVKLRL